MMKSMVENNAAVWFCNYVNDGTTLTRPVMQVGKESVRFKYNLDNPIDTFYTFCRVDIEDGGDFAIGDIYEIKVPGDRENPNMNMYISNDKESSEVYIAVKNSYGNIVIEKHYRVGNAFKDEISSIQAPNDLNKCEKYCESANDVISESAENPESNLDKEMSLEAALKKLDEMPGLSDIKKDLEEVISLVKLNELRKNQGKKPIEDLSYHLVFSGNPGTGKTTVARLVSDIYAQLGVTSTNKFVEVDRGDLVEGYVGQTATKTKKVLDSARGGVLFIDEAYMLAGEENDFGKEAIATILKDMEDHRDDLIVIAAGYQDKMSKFIHSNSGLESRFKKFIAFRDYSGEELYEIFGIFCKNNDLKVEDKAKEPLKEHFMAMAKNKSSEFANGREVRNYFEETISRQALRLSKLKNVSGEELSTITREDLGIVDNKEIQMEAIKELDAMIGLENIKNETKEWLNEKLNQQQREKNKLPTEKTSNHMVFTGNPGTGKTTVARIMARIFKSLGIISDDKIIEVKSSDLIAGYTGQTAIKTTDVVNSALGGVLFIDEAYMLEKSVGGFGQEAIDTILKMMEDNRNNLVVIVAGYENEMKKFIESNPGLESRFSTYVHFDDYSPEELYEIMEFYCAKERYALDDAAKDKLKSYIADRKDEFTGNARDIRNLFEKIKKQQATRLAGKDCSIEELIRVTESDVVNALTKLSEKR